MQTIARFGKMNKAEVRKVTFIILVGVLISCASSHKHINLRTVSQIVPFNKEFIVVRVPEIEGEGSPVVQLLDSNLNQKDEIRLMEPYPFVSVTGNDVAIRYQIFKSNEKSFLGLYNYYKAKFKNLGSHDLSYTYEVIGGSQLGKEITFDSLEVVDGIASFYFGGKKIIDIQINKIIKNRDTLIYWDIRNNIKVISRLVPENLDMLEEYWEGVLLSS